MSYLFLYLAAINIIAFAAMGIDKAKARAGKWRIAEGTLFALAALGGALGGTLGMRVFHHKTKHKEFRFGFPALLCLQCAAVVYPLVCALHGLAFGTLYAPAQALIYGLSLEGMLAWIVAGLPWDVVHALGNLAAGVLILPLSELLRRLNAKFGIAAAKGDK